MESEAPVRDQAYWREWAAQQREAKRAAAVQVEVKSPSDIADLNAQALASPANFAEWPLRLQVPEHHRLWYEYTQMYLKDPKYRKLLILAPTGWGKTTVFNVGLPVYEVAKDKSIPIGLISSNLDNAKQKLATITRQLTENRQLIEGFAAEDDQGVRRFKPKLKTDTWTRTEIVVQGASQEADRRGRLLSDPTIAVFGWNSAQEGRHWDLAICDDVVDYIDAQSPIVRAQYIDWYLNVFKRRMNREGREVWIGTRAHAADLYQYLIDTGEYTVIDEPQALAWVDGEEVSTWPQMYSTESLLKDRLLDPVSFALKKMNKITGEGLSEFPKEKVELTKDTSLGYYGNRQNLPRELQDRNLMIYAGVDLATGFTDDSKWFVVVVVGVDMATQERFLLHLTRGKLGVTDQRTKVKEMYGAWLPTKIMVENNGVQAYFYEDSFAGIPVVGINTGTNKVNVGEGIPSLVGLVKAQKLHVPWMDAHAQYVSGPFIKEMIDFPKGDSSDVVMGWWFAEREIRKHFLAPPKTTNNRNFFQRQRIQNLRQRFGGFQHGRRVS